ncbi:MAG: hypothetical protein IKA82_02500 [Clostridia bacterium]|nr:hypothetical protein [Clostridia bacterium]
MIVFLRILLIIFVSFLALCIYLVFSSMEYLWLFLIAFVATVSVGVILAVVDKPHDNEKNTSTPETLPRDPEVEEQPPKPCIDAHTVAQTGSSLQIIPLRRSGMLAVINSQTIQKHFENGDTVSLDTLRKKGIIRNNGICRIKIIVTSSIFLALNIEADIISNTDAWQFIQSGGTVKKYR